MLPDGSEACYTVSTLSYWEGLYKKGGFDALVHRSRSDSHSRRLDADATEAITLMRQEFPRINATIIYERLVSTGIIDEHEVSLSTVQRFVRAKASALVPMPATKDRLAFESEKVCGIWQADTMYGPYVIEGRKSMRTYLMIIIDDKSRLITGARFFLADTAPNFQTVFKDAVIRFGIPEKLFADNGGPYKNDQLTGICGRLGCVLVHAAVGDGAAKGKVERLNRTCRSRLLAVLTDEQKASLEAINSALAKWVSTYNTTVHSALGITPMDAYTKGVGDVRVPKDAAWVAECFLNRISRTVRNDSTVTIDKVSYDVPMQFISTRVEIRHSPKDMSDAHIVADRVTYPIVPTDRVANSKVPRQSLRYRLLYQSAKEGDGDV